MKGKTNSKFLLIPVILPLAYINKFAFIIDVTVSVHWPHQFTFECCIICSLLMRFYVQFVRIWFLLGQKRILKVQMEINWPPSTSTALKEVLMGDSTSMIYWKSSVIMDLHHQELAYLVDREKGNSEKRRNYGKFLRCFC